jgi:hypothetical protein
MQHRTLSYHLPCMSTPLRSRSSLWKRCTSRDAFAGRQHQQLNIYAKLVQVLFKPFRRAAQ